jgi:uncharacterized protein
MSLLLRIKKDHIQARKDRDEVKSKVIGTLIGEFDRNFVKSDDDIVSITGKMVSNINDTSPEGQKEIEILSVYLPTMLNNSEINEILDEVVESLGCSSVKDRGLVMKHFKTNYNGRYDGKVLSEMVKSKLEKLS